MTEIKKCPHCGRQLHKDAQYCMYCMTSLHPKKDITPKGAARGKWWIVCVILLILAVAILIYLLGRDGNGNLPTRKESTGAVLKTNGEAVTTDPPEETTPEEVTPEATTPEVDSTGPVTESEPQVKPTTGNENPVIPEGTQLPEHPESTEPVTQPDTPVQCDHVYTAANCLTPATCTLCGKTVGTPDMQAHTWKPVTKVVHHEEEGHYETVEVSYKKTVYLCFFCGYNQDGYDSLDLLREHITVHSNAHNYEAIIASPDMLADTREVWATRKEQQWVVDKEAYDETVITGYICTRCDQQKGPDV